jgi:hypothetical protein
VADGDEREECGAPDNRDSMPGQKFDQPLRCGGQSRPLCDLPFRIAVSRQPGRQRRTRDGPVADQRAQLLDVYDAKIEQTTLGTEFNAAGLSGILDGTGAKAKVTNLWSGVNCVFR